MKRPVIVSVALCATIAVISLAVDVGFTTRQPRAPDPIKERPAYLAFIKPIIRAEWLQKFDKTDKKSPTLFRAMYMIGEDQIYKKRYHLSDKEIEDILFEVVYDAQ